MQRIARRRAVATTLVVFASLTAAASDARERQLLDANWKFHEGDESGAARADFDDGDWSTVNLPHDWSINGAFRADAPSGGSGGYLPTGVGWYRRTFDIPDSWRDQIVTIDFEGVYHRCEVWLNGQSLGRHAYGYTPFRFELTPHLKFGEPNVLAVRVDNSEQHNCRWYSGSGIYRHVWLEAISGLWLDRNQLFATTTHLSNDEATVVVEAGVAGDRTAYPKYEIAAVLRDPTGEAVATSSGDDVVSLTIARPHFWTPSSPSLYMLVTYLLVDGRAIDRLRTPIGLRTVKVSPERGFELNGQPMKLIGACVHHDNGPLGAAAFDRAEERRVELLKAAGFNAIRTSHNPPSSAFLDACDRLGMLVIDEAFDGWAAPKTPRGYHLDFAENWNADLESFIRRDRNHPCVVMWSIGNEMFERAEESGAKISAEMAAVNRQLDATRPITVACNHVNRSDEGWRRVDRVFAPLEVAGYNYQLDVLQADHERLPDRIICATESFPFETFRNWDMMDRRPYFIGDFVWTGMDYLGESGLGRVFAPGEQARDPWVGPPQFPYHGALCGDIDLTGWRKPNSHYRNILWNRGEKLYAAVVAPAPEGGQWQLTRWSQTPALPSWTWPGHEGKELEVVAYSRYPAVRLYVNDKLIGEQPTGREQEFKTTFRVPYEPGELRVVGVDNVSEVEEFKLATVGDASQIRLTSDRTELAADGQDLAFVTVEVSDQAGRWRPDAAVPVKYEITGPGTIAAIGSADLAASQSYGANPRDTYQGRSLVVVRTTDAAGEITLTASSPGLLSTTIALDASAP
jgi:beta-galactosidase